MSDSTSPSIRNSDRPSEAPETRVPFEVVPVEIIEAAAPDATVDETAAELPSDVEAADNESTDTESTETEAHSESVLAGTSDASNEDPAAEATAAESKATSEDPQEDSISEEPTSENSTPDNAEAATPEPATADVPAKASASGVSGPQANQPDRRPPQAPQSKDGGDGFGHLGLNASVVSAITNAGYDTPTPIQNQTVPHILSGRDLIGQAETGSGKTAAFAWPLLSRIDVSNANPQVLVLTPTRELAVQVTNAFRKYAADVRGFRTTTIYGGQSYETQFRDLERGAHVVVGTPGRLMDHLKRGSLDLSQLKTLVLDEADEMLRMGFIDDIEWILQQTPRTQQSLFFSATMPAPIKRIAQKYLRNPEHVHIASDTATADSISQYSLLVEPRQKLQQLVRFLETEDTDAVLVFVKTRHSTLVVGEHLVQNGFIAASLNGDIPQQQRERMVSQLKSGKIKVLVATDVAARGLDVPSISHVINYDFPHDTEAYVHRIGRTGRAGRSGEAILFVEPRERGKLARLQQGTNQPIAPLKEKSLDEINQRRIDKFKHRILDAMDDAQFQLFQRLADELASESGLEHRQIAAAMGVVAQGDSPLLLKALPTPTSNWKKERRNSRDAAPSQTYRVEVGRTHGVGPGNLVGAITNEANLTNADLGRIQIFDRFSTIDLPADLPADLVQHLSQVLVGGQPLQLSVTDQAPRGRQSHGGGNRRGGPRDSRSARSGPRHRPASGSTGTYPKRRRRDDNATGSGDRRSYGSKPGSAPAHRSAGNDRPERKSGHTSGSSDRRPYGAKPGTGPSQRPSGNDKSARKSTYGDTDARPRKPGGKKTKAALRTQSKRKPDATLSSPVKKYVKIRAVKGKKR